MSKSTMKNIIDSRVVSIIFLILFILTPLLSAILFCAIDGRTIGDIYIPLGGWSDEITYYKQIEGMLSHGVPRGYFGFNQSKAIYGSFAYWGFLPLIPYVIWGYFLGWTYTSPVYANIFFCILAFAFIYFFLRPCKKWCISFSLFWILFQFLNRHVLSGVVEASVIQQLVFVVVIGECLLSEKKRMMIGMTRNKENILIILCTIIIFFMTVVRPYYAVYYLIPFWAVVRDKKRIGMIAVPVTAFLSIVCFVLYKKYTCAAYFDDVILMDDMLSAGIAGGFSHIINDVLELMRYIWYALRYQDVVGWYYLFFFVELAIMLFVCIYNLGKKKSLPQMYVVTLVGNGLILFSIILLYNLVVGGRHILPLIVVNSILLLTETHIGIGGFLSGLAILCTVLSGNNEPLPYAEEKYVEWMKSLEKVFAEHIEVTDIMSYDNVVGMPVSDKDKEDASKEVVTYYGLLYAMPAGMGVSLDFESFYDNPQNIKAKYVLAHPDGMIRQKLEDAGMNCIIEMEELVVYERQ